MNQLGNRYDSAKATLSACGQDHLLTFYDALDDADKAILLDQIEGIDWPEVARLVKAYVVQKPSFTLPENVEPAPWYPREPNPDQHKLYADAWDLGLDLLRRGALAAFTVAGGQGTRLGWDAPKGTFPATPLTGKSLFACFADYLHRVVEKYQADTPVPWYVMTSPVNDAATRAFFEQHDHFGYDPADVMIFPQAMMPAFDMQTGKALLADRGSIALSPNGHGGSLKALWTSGAVADMKRRGIEQISYIQVDNPLVRVIDPLFIGLHAHDKAQMSSKMLPKREPLEKLGNICVVDGKTTVIEYSDLPDELAYETQEDGELRFRAGSIAIHVIDVAFVESLNTSAQGFALPWHRAEKKVPFIDLDTGKPVEPDTPNAVKLETFVFDALPMCDSSIVFQTGRTEEFAPVKNADAPGAQDSPATSKQLQSDRAAIWLAAAGVAFDWKSEGVVNAVVELSQRVAIYADDVEGRCDLPKAVPPGGELLIDAPAS
jgi:UDP-N-acetylglucosamine/UDP-N-acetylgalactosamine diphosphorylase